MTNETIFEHVYRIRRVEEEIALLKMWLDSGLELGNHTYSHRSLNRIPIEEYKAENPGPITLSLATTPPRGEGVRTATTHPRARTLPSGNAVNGVSFSGGRLSG